MDATDVGATLRSQREQRGLSLNQLSRSTRISVPILIALEHNEIEKLPGGIFTRGFLRAYAREVGLDPEETVSRYLAQFGTMVDKETVAEKEPARPSVVPDEIADDQVDLRARYGPLLAASLALALVSAVYVAFRTPATPPPPPYDVAPEVLASEQGPVILATSGPDVEVALAAGDGEGVRLDIEAEGPCWIAATADGVTVVYRLMQAGERQRIEARDDLVIRVGDPAVFTYRINGLPGRTLGRAGQAVTVRISPENYREFTGAT
ncbi:MAG: helix-turn-helix domain-containing protein [Acidobacteria bacterium]|nr:helix-turn-helix domain-containing protein [Acidobacteriota bacterium]